MVGFYLCGYCCFCDLLCFYFLFDLLCDYVFDCGGGGCFEIVVCFEESVEIVVDIWIVCGCYVVF